MEIRYLEFPKERFPRFENASEKFKQLHSRYCDLIQEKNNVQEIENVMVVLFKKKIDAKFPVEVNDLNLCSSNFSNIETGILGNSDFLEKIEKSVKSACVFIVRSEDKGELKHLKKYKGHIILLAKNEDDKKEVEENCSDKRNIIVSTKEKLAKVIDNLLERIALAPLKPICEQCYEMFVRKISIKTETTVQTVGNERNKSPNRKRKGEISSKQYLSEKSLDLKLSKCNSKERHKIIQYDKNDKTTNCSSGVPIFATAGAITDKNVDQTCVSNTLGTIKETVLCQTSTATSRSAISSSIPNMKINGLDKCLNSEATRFPCKNTNKRLSRKRTLATPEVIVKKDKKKNTEESEQTSSKDHQKTEENPEHLLEAILAVYEMSNVPQSDKPEVPKQSKIIDKQMKEELFNICPSIKRVGYRYRTFYIYAVHLVKQEDERIRNNKICSVLRKYEIFPYEIAPCEDTIKKLMHTGAKILAKSGPCYSLRSRASCSSFGKKGTLGGFVKTNAEDIYCLLSKHVTEHCSDVYYVENSNNKRLGSMITQTNHHIDGGLDISAARMNEPVSEENSKFKDTHGRPFKGKLHTYVEGEEDITCRSGQSVHIHGAVSKPGKGEITMPFVYENGLWSPLIQVEDISTAHEECKHFAEEGDSGAVVCVEDPERRHINALGMVIGDISKGLSKRKYLALPLSKGLQQIEEQTNSRLELI